MNDAYRYAQGDVEQLQAEMEDFESELDTSLSNDAGIVFEDARGRIQSDGLSHLRYQLKRARAFGKASGLPFR